MPSRIAYCNVLHFVVERRPTAEHHCSIPRGEHGGGIMSIRIPITVLSLALLVAYSSLSAQPIYRPFSGERGIEMVRDIAEKELISRMGEPCGEYFLFEEIGEQKVLTFKVPITKREEREATNSLVRVDIRLIVIELDDEKIVPTAEYERSGLEPGERGKLMIRISRRDYEGAECLPRKGT